MVTVNKHSVTLVSSKPAATDLYLNTTTGISCYTELLISLFNRCNNNCLSHTCGSCENIIVIKVLRGPWRQWQNIFLKEVSVRLKNNKLN